jgi:hypothetical protein
VKDFSRFVLFFIGGIQLMISTVQFTVSIFSGVMNFGPPSAAEPMENDAEERIGLHINDVVWLKGQ